MSGASIDRTLEQPEADILRDGPGSLMLLGTSRRGREIWLDRDAMTRHMMVVGTTGSGKSELLLGMSANAIASGNGVLFVDGKGDIATFAKLHAIAERFGRGGDVLLLNLSGKPVIDADGRVHPVSNSLNPFQDLPASDITTIVTSMMEMPERDAMWHARAVAMVTAVVDALVWLRDAKDTPLTIDRLRQSCSLGEIIKLASTLQHRDMPDTVRRGLDSYLDSLPGYMEHKGALQSNTTMEQHGYLQMQVTRLFSLLGDTYAHVFDTPGSQIDMRDVVLNRRILMVMLPVLEKSTVEIAILGRIVVALLKNMMATAMRAPIEGAWKDVVDKRPTQAEYPFLVILDEVSHYMTDGMGAMAGQARSLGFCLVFAAQDLSGMDYANRREAAAIQANTGTKIYMRMLDPSELDHRGVLPSSTRYSNGMSEASDRTRDEIRLVSERFERANGGRGYFAASDRGELQAIGQQLLELYEHAVEQHDIYPQWTLMPLVKTLQPGEFVLVHGAEFIAGMSFSSAPSVERAPIALNHGLPWIPDAAAMRERHGRKARRIALRQKLLENPGEVLGSLKVSGLQPPSPEGDSKSMIRRSFAALFDPTVLLARDRKPSFKTADMDFVSMSALVSRGSTS